ncbi:MAG: exopolyphosphatase [Pseudomonadota bacterium]
MTAREKDFINKEAIIDLGSNSIRMLIYDNILNSQIPVFNEKAVCQLGKNLDRTGKLDPKGAEFALTVLKRFKEQLLFERQLMPKSLLLRLKKLLKKKL